MKGKRAGVVVALAALALLRAGSSLFAADKVKAVLVESGRGKPGCLRDGVPGYNDPGTLEQLLAERRSRGACADLTGLDFLSAHLNYADFSGALFPTEARYIELVSANLVGAKMDGVDLTGAILYGAELRKASLRGAKLCDADLRGHNLDEADLKGAFYDAKTIFPVSPIEKDDYARDVLKMKKVESCAAL